MFFNPLFISNASTGNSIDGAKENKFTNTNYLFADIINVSKEKLAINSETNIELESKNKVLFKNFEKPTSDSKNNYFGDDATVVDFLTSILTRIETSKNSLEQGSIKKTSKGDIPPFNLEIINSIIDDVNKGKKISIPILNNGEKVFVEIQKNNELLKNSDSPKVIKLTQLNKTNTTDINYDKVIANILSSLKEKFNSDEFNMSEEKILLLTSKIEMKFSKLVSVNDETFAPQKNILSTLITETQKDINLSVKESDELKKTIVDEFVKVINSGNIAESTQPVSAIEEKQVALPSLSNKLGLTSKEIKMLESIELENLSLPEVSEKLKAIFSDPSQSSEVKSLIKKVEVYLKTNTETSTTENISSKFALPTLGKVLNLTSKEEAIVKDISSEKLTLPDLNDKLRLLPKEELQSSEVKSLIKKVEVYLKSNTETSTTENVLSKFTLPTLGKVLNLTPKEEAIVKDISSEKLTLPDLNDKLRLLPVKKIQSSEVKSLIKKVEVYLKSNTETSTTENVLSKFTLPTLGKVLNLTPKEEAIVKDISSEKLTLPDLNDKLRLLPVEKLQSSEVKSLIKKVEVYLKSNTETSTSENISSKFTLPTLGKVLNLTPKEEAIVKDISSEKLALTDLNDKLRLLPVEKLQSSEVKSLIKKVEVYLKSNTETSTTENVLSKFTLPTLGKVLNLTPKESIVVQSLVSEKNSLSEVKNELKALENLGKSSPEIKSVIHKIETILSPKGNVVSEIKSGKKLSLMGLSQKLNLTSNETEVVQKESFNRVSVPKLKEIIKEKISLAPKNTELKTLFAKIEKLEIKTTPIENVGTNEKLLDVNQKKSASETSFVDKVKSGIKNVFANKEIVSGSENVEKEKYLVSLKSEKSTESIILNENVFAKKTKPELLNKTIYASKENVDLTKLKIVPINENASKENQITQDKDTKLIKVSNDKNEFVESRIAKKESSSNSSNMGNKESFQNKQAAIINTDVDTEKSTESNKLKPFEKTIIKSLEAESSNSTVKESKTESNILHKTDSSNIKVEEQQLSKFAVSQNQIFKDDLRVNQKTIYKRININNLNREITNLIQKGEKKIVQFQLTPDNLGKLDIRLEVVNKVISATIKVDNEITQQLVQNSLEGLKTTLNQNGVQYNSLNVSLSNSEDKNQRFFKQKRKNNNATNKMNVEGFDETFTHKNLGYNKYDFIA